MFEKIQKVLINEYFNKFNIISQYKIRFQQNNSAITILTNEISKHVDKKHHHYAYSWISGKHFGTVN